jgi:hypothetical protein
METGITKVKSLEDLKLYYIFGAKIDGAEKTVPILFIGDNSEWYHFIRRQDNEENILDTEVNRDGLLDIEGFVNIKEPNSIQKIYTPHNTGYYYRRDLLVNYGLWGKSK